MINVNTLVIKHLLENPDIDNWNRLKVEYFPNESQSVFRIISNFYDKYAKLPNATDIKLITRDTLTKFKLEAILLQEYPEHFNIDIAIEALINEYAQSITLNYIENLVDNIVFLDRDTIKEEIANISLRLDKELDPNKEVIRMNNITIFEDTDDGDRVYLGINNEVDSAYRGVALTEFILIGGFRGAGKSVVATNIVCNQYQQGNVGVIFSIEMRAREIFNRCMSILADVPHASIKKECCTPEEIQRLATLRCNMFTSGSEYLSKYGNDLRKLDENLNRYCELKPDNQLIIIDSPKLTLGEIDAQIQALKTQFNDKLKVVVIDYLNQIDIANNYEWMSQIFISKKLKEIARKYNIVMISPYQIDEEGKTRFAKGILDSCDWAFTLAAEPAAIQFKTTKIRNEATMDFRSGIDWKTLKINPASSPPPEEKEKKVKKSKSDETSKDITPWK